jgi:hypothetical protein
MAEVTDDRIPSATNSSISRFWQRAEWPIPRVEARSTPELRDVLQQEVSDFQQTVGNHIRFHEIPPEHIYVAD